MADKPQHDAYHLSSGEDSLSYADIVETLRRAGHRPRTIFVPRLEGTFNRAVETLMDTPRSWKNVSRGIPHEGFLAVPHLQHRVRQLSHRGIHGAQARAFFNIRVPAIALRG